MKIYHTKSNLLPLYLKQKGGQIIHLSNIKEVYDHAPRWLDNRGQTYKVMLFKGNVSEQIAPPKWEGELYILGKSVIGQEINLDLYELLPDLNRYKRLFTRPCWYFLEKRYKTYPLICEWELSLLLDWVSKEGAAPIDTDRAIDLLQIGPPSELMMTEYKRVWGTKKGAKFLYKLKDADLWLLIHKCLEFHLQRVGPELMVLLQDTRNRCEQGSPLREEAIMLNSLISQYTSSRDKFKG